MDVRAVDLCVVRKFRLTENQVFNGSDYVYTYFNIRDDQGVVYGHNYDEVEKPLDIMLSLDNNEKLALYSA